VNGEIDDLESLHANFRTFVTGFEHDPTMNFDCTLSSSVRFYCRAGTIARCIRRNFFRAFNSCT
jgi:hypothetical protein